jgi:ATP-dependent helicase IRC3
MGNFPTVLGLQPWERMVVLTHLEELAAQTVGAMQRENPDLRIGLEKAQSHADPDSDIVVASIQTLSRAPHRLDPSSVKIVAVDECHHATSTAWMKVLKHLRVLKGEDNRDPERRLYGVSATPRRADAAALERIFDRIVYRKGIREMINEGWLADPIAYRVETDADLDSVSVRAGDFATGELSRAVNTPNQNALVVKKYVEYGEGLPAIAFTVDIIHSETLAATFREHGLHFEAISSNTPTQKRKEIIDAYRKGDILGLCSCQALLEAFDAPIATVALWDRPTQSGLLYTQGLGRVLRPYPAPEAAATHTGYVKTKAIVIDFAGVTRKFRLYTASNLFGLHPKFNMEGRSITKTLEHLEGLQREHPTLDISAYAGLADVEAAAVSVNLWKPPAIPKLAKTCSRFVWMGAGDNAYRLSAPGMSVCIEVDHLGRYGVSRLMNGAAGPDSYLEFTEPEDSFAYADSLVPDEVVTLMLANSRWRKESPSEAQCELLWHKDPIVRKGFTGGQDFYRFACYQFSHGNVAFSRGNVSQRIEIAKRALREKKALAGVG